MDYEKKYNEALEKAKELLDSPRTCFDIVQLKDIFPELRESESEDERIRKELVEKISNLACGCFISQEQKQRFIHYLEKQKEQKPKNILTDDDSLQTAYLKGQTDVFEDPEAYGLQKEQKPVEKQDYSGLNDLERAILRGFLCAGVENVPVGIIKDTAAECIGFLALIEQKPAEWNDADMREARNNLISVCRDWERGEKTTLIPLVAVRARYFLEHLTEPKPAECIEDSVKFEEGFKAGRESGLRDGQKYVLDNAESYGLCKPVEWSEEDEVKLKQCIRIVTGWEADYDVVKSPYSNFLKSLRPSWKPSEEHLSALLAIFNDPNNIGSQTCQLALTDLYEQLKKL